MSCRHLRRLREAYDKWGFDGLHDGRVGRESPRRKPVAVVEEVLRLYRDEYFDFNVRHFHEKLMEKHSMTVSYTLVKALLQGSGLATKDRPRKKHRRRRERKPLPGMMEHIDGSKHQWFGDERWFDLIVLSDDATSGIDYAQLVDAESTRTVMAGIREVVETKGIFCSMYSDRASHFWLTPKAGEPVDRQALTQVGRALRDLGIRMIPAYSPQARGRSERGFRTWQGRLPQEPADTQFYDTGGGQPIFARRIYRRVQSEVCRPGHRAGRVGLRSLHPRGSRPRLFDSNREDCQSRQYREIQKPDIANRQTRLAAVNGRLPLTPSISI